MESALVVLAGGLMVTMVFALVSLFKTQNILREMHRDHVGIINNAMVHLKAQNAHEAAEAKALEKETDVRIEMLKDALRQEQEMVEQLDEPRYVKTEGGEMIDMRDYELV
jgi:uncharacterized protein YybS (DUF2232 family)